jgi:hypothetical protein
MEAPVSATSRVAPTVVCIVGMHRSGTSLVARMLNLLGVHLGPDEFVLRTGDDNPKGYWEHRLFVEVNETILARFGGSWDAPPAFPADWPRSSRLGDLRDKARALMQASFAGRPLWGWKDPRTCLTLPFWQDLIGPMRYVMCVRNPRGVAASLARRNAMRVEDADRLWLAHTEASLAGTVDQPRLFVFYEDLLDSWPEELRRMAAFVGRPERAEEPGVRDAVRAFLDVELCHDRSTLADLVGDERISRPTKDLYVTVKDVGSVRLLLHARDSRAVPPARATTLRGSDARADGRPDR